MIRVQFQRFSRPDPIPTWLDGDVRAVPAEPFVGDVDEGQGGITFADIVDGTIAPLSTFAVGAEVYVESEDATDCLLDDTDTTTERDTHIWWRATILGEGGQP